jgi:hypothetical protein
MCPPEATAESENRSIGIVKPENIVSDSAVQEGYSRDISFTPPSNPLLALYPEKWGGGTGSSQAGQ